MSRKFRFPIGHRLVVMGLCFFCLVWTLPLEAVFFATSYSPVPDKKEVEKIYLVHTDKLHYKKIDNPDANILNGNVVFLHNGVHMYCDSAYFYRESNSFEAFSRVKMLQGDTLSLTGDYLYYDGNTQIAQVRRNVVLKHRNSVLYTDSLNYDRMYDLGYFFEGGRLLDKGNVLTSDWGEYSPATREAVFNYHVKLENPRFVLTSDTLHYNTLTSLAHIVGPSNIVSGDSRIYSESGYYNTQTEYAQLFDRSVVVNKGRTMVSDSMNYDKQTGVTEAFGHMVYIDKVSKNGLTGNYGIYNELTGYAMATDSTVAIDYSAPDTLYVHADTFKLYSHYLDTDSTYRELHGYRHVRAYRADVQGVCDSLFYDTRTACMSMYENPIVWNNNQQLLGEEIHIHLNDSTVDSVHVVRQALLVEKMDSIYYNQIAGREMKAYFRTGQLDWGKVVGNVQTVYYPLDSDSSMIGLSRLETSEMRFYLKEKKMNRIWSAPATGTLYPLGLASPDLFHLENFAWFDYIRPLDKDDLFEWRGKKAGTELKQSIRRHAPLQMLNRLVEKKLPADGDISSAEDVASPVENVSVSE